MTPRLHIDDHIAEVGGFFTGNVVLDPDHDNPGRVRGLDLQLRWSTLGRGDTDNGQLPSVRVPARPDGGIESVWSVPVPLDGPISYHGRLMAIEWELTATLDVSRRIDPNWTQVVLVVPQNGQSHYAGPHPLPG